MRHLTYANVCATLALVAAVGGASADAAGLIGTAQLRDGAVTGPKLAYGSVTSTRIKNGTIVAGDLAPGLLPAPANTAVHVALPADPRATPVYGSIARVGNLVIVGACQRTGAATRLRIGLVSSTGGTAHHTMEWVQDGESTRSEIASATLGTAPTALASLLGSALGAARADGTIVYRDASGVGTFAFHLDADAATGTCEVTGLTAVART